jgi:protein TonB
MTWLALAADVLAVSAQVFCLIAIAEVLVLVVRINAPAVRYQYWRTLMLFCLVLPWLQERQVGVASVTTIATMAFPSTTAPLAWTAGAARTVSNVPWLEVAIWIVVAGVAFRLARFGWVLIRLRELRRSGRLAPASAEHDDLQRMLGTKAEIRFVPDEQPVTCGTWRPVVLLPERLTSQPAAIQRAVLTHELLHVRRRDWSWMMGEELLRAVFWFHPGVWWLVARVRLAREEVVDECTVRVTGQRRAYLEALLAFADVAPLTAGAAFGRRRHLFRRMTLISKEAAMSSKRVVVSCAVLVIGVAAGSRYAVSAFPLAQAPQAPGVIQPAQSPADGEEGPLERSAKAITPENPIPRRTYAVTPRTPAGAIVAPIVVTVRVTVNALGRVGEARLYAGPLGGSPPATDSYAKAALDAVRQWVFEPPADGPISFNVSFVFAPGAEPRLIAYGGPLGVESAAAGGLVAGAVPPVPPPPPPPPWVRDGVTEAMAPVRIGGAIKPPTKTKDVRPVYPPIAQSSHLQGVVILEAVIGSDGRVNRVAVLRSIPLLDQAAMDAVKDWEFTPTLLNGTPVPVSMTTTVNFTLK